MGIRGKNILLGVGGGIAAYKSVELARRLKDAGANVRVVMTDSAMAFVGPLTFQAATGERVGTALLDPESEAGMGHIELAKWADILLVAPATAGLIARLASGLANDLLTTIHLATTAELVLAPAMNQAMWRHPAVTANAELLASRGARLLGPASGMQACGDDGPGRMLEPDELIAQLDSESANGLLSGKQVLMTAGPTFEDIDPVRFIANRSSGKMGYAVAEACAVAGARVTLVAGPVKLPVPRGVDVVPVRSAQAMHEAIMQRIKACDVFIATAAVADFRPAERSDQKIKKGTSDLLTLNLIRNPDILADVGALDERPFAVGFAAETQRLEEHARGKLKRKNVDMIVANDVSRSDCGFESDENEVLVLTRDNTIDLGRASKRELARHLVEIIAQHL